MSATLLSQTRALIGPVDEAEVHVVHVVAPEPPFLRIVRPRDAKDAGAVHEIVARANGPRASVHLARPRCPDAGVPPHSRGGHRGRIEAYRYGGGRGHSCHRGARTRRGRPPSRASPLHVGSHREHRSVHGPDNPPAASRRRGAEVPSRPGELRCRISSGPAGSKGRPEHFTSSRSLEPEERDEPTHDDEPERHRVACPISRATRWTCHCKKAPRSRRHEAGRSFPKEQAPNGLARPSGGGHRGRDPATLNRVVGLLS